MCDTSCGETNVELLNVGESLNVTGLLDISLKECSLRYGIQDVDLARSQGNLRALDSRR